MQSPLSLAAQPPSFEAVVFSETGAPKESRCAASQSGDCITALQSARGGVIAHQT
jgi:hypothetical protein